MANRPGQDGTIVRKGNHWHLRYHEDIPGQYERPRRSVKIALAVGPGSVSKTEAKQLGKKFLADKGINSKAHFEKTCSTFKSGASLQTFVDRVKHWDSMIKPFTRGRTQKGMSCAVNKYFLPLLENYPLNAINEDVAQSFVPSLSQRGLSPKTVRVYYGYLRSVLGKKACRDWEVKLPSIPGQEQFSFSPDQMVKIVSNSEGQERVIAITLVETGMRINEALGLHVED